MAILLISDEIPEVYFNADRVLHMRGGRLVADVSCRAQCAIERDRGGGPCLGSSASLSRTTEGWLVVVIVADRACFWRSPPTRFLTLGQPVRPAQRQRGQRDLRRRPAGRAGRRRDRHLVRGRGLGRAVPDGAGRRCSWAAATGRWASCSRAVSAFALGAINAALIYHFRIISIVVTIATFNLFFGAPDVLHAGRVDLRPAGLVARPARSCSSTRPRSASSSSSRLPGGRHGRRRPRDLGPACSALTLGRQLYALGRQSGRRAADRHRHRRHALSRLWLARRLRRHRRADAGALRPGGRAERALWPRAGGAGRGGPGRRPARRRARHACWARCSAWR